MWRSKPEIASIPIFAVPSLQKKKGKTASRAETKAAYVFILPSLIFFILFQAIPIIAVIALTFTKYNLFNTPQFIGFGNYIKLLTDPRFLQSLSNTFFITILYVAGLLILGLLIALGINSLMSSNLRSLFRTMYFIPMMTSFAAVSVVWWYLLNTDFGVLNYYLLQLNLQPIPWISSSKYAIYSVVLVSVWKNIGFDFVILLAGLRQIPKSIIEAAMIDGASSFQRLWRITLPMLSPSIFFCIVINLIDGLQLFDIPKIMTQGGPGDSTQTIVMYLYETGFRYFEMGYASTMALVLLVLIMILTLLQFALSGRWVFYEFKKE